MMCWWSIDMLVGGYCWYYWGTLIAQFFILSIHPSSQPASSLIQFRPAERGAGAYPSFWERCRVCQDAVTWQYKPPLYPYYKSNSVTVCLCTCNESQTKPALNHWWKGPTTVKESSRKCDRKCVSFCSWGFFFFALFWSSSCFCLQYWILSFISSKKSDLSHS